MNNPPAFPYLERVPFGYTNHFGLSMRDYFAAAALQGWVVRYGSSSIYEESAHAAYKFADAMLAQRQKPIDSTSTAP